MSNRNINRIEITQYINRINPILCSFVLIYCIFHKGFENFLELKHSRVSEKGLYKWKFSILVCVMRFEPTNIVHSDLFRRYRILNLVSFFFVDEKHFRQSDTSDGTWEVYVKKQVLSRNIQEHGRNLFNFNLWVKDF